MHGTQALLRVDARAHLGNRSNEDAHLALVHVIEQALLRHMRLVIRNQRDFLFRNAAPGKLLLDVFVNREVAVDPEVREDHLRGGAMGGGLLAEPFAVRQRVMQRHALERLVIRSDLVDHRFELGARLLGGAGVDEAVVYCCFAPIIDDRQDNVIALLWRATAGLDRTHTRRQFVFVGFLVGRHFDGDHLPFTALEGWQADVLAKLCRTYHVHDLPDHHGQFRNIHELGKAGLRFIAAARLIFQCSDSIAKGACPGVEVTKCALVQFGLLQVAADAE